MGDDAAGILVIQQLEARADLPPNVAVMDGGTQGLGLIPVLEAYRRVILVDAVQMDQPAGTVRRFLWQDVRAAEGSTPLSLHQSSLADALALADALGSLPPEVVIYGVQPHNTEWDQPLSAAVAEALPSLVEALINEVRRKDSNGEENTDYR